VLRTNARKSSSALAAKAGAVNNSASEPQKIAKDRSIKIVFWGLK
jgi:hypothetical protein